MKTIKKNTKIILIKSRMIYESCFNCINRNDGFNKCRLLEKTNCKNTIVNSDYTCNYFKNK